MIHANNEDEADANAWMIVVAAATIAAIAMGLRQVLGLYLRPVSMDLGLGREAFGLAIALANLVWGIAAPIAGAIADRFGAGRVVIAGGVATAAGLFVMFQAERDWHLLISGFLMGLGVAGAGINALVGVVARTAAPDERTQAIAAIGIGSGIGILIALPYTHYLMELLGWQQSLVVLAATALLILPLAAAVKGRPPLVDDEPSPPLSGALKDALELPSFWLLMASFFVCGFHVVFYATHLPAYIADQGLATWVGTAALTLVGLGNLIGTWLAGQWGRIRPKRYGLAAIYFGRAIVFLGFPFLPITVTSVLVMSGLLGLLWLATIPLTSGLVATFFGTRWLTTLYGLVFLAHQLGSFLGAWLAGFLYDQFQSYDAMWWISVALGVAAGVLSLPIREEMTARPVLQPH